VSSFRDRDVRRLIKSAKESGLNPTAVEVDIRTGRIRVITGKAGEATGGDLDKWLEGHREGSAEGRQQQA
jgi:hypothetical protein